MSDQQPVQRGIAPWLGGLAEPAGLGLSDISLRPKWRLFSGYERVPPGTSKLFPEGLVWSVSPGEWTLLGDRPREDAVDLTHVRAMFRLTGQDAVGLLSRICGLDLGDRMFPDGAAGRTLVAGVATELVRQDSNGRPSYLILPSRSFGVYLYGVLLDAGEEFGVEKTAAEGSRRS